MTSDGMSLHEDEFYIIPDLPLHYLIGRPLLTNLGCNSAKIDPAMSAEYRHQRVGLDSFPEEDISRDPNPLRRKTYLNTTATVAGRNTKLTICVQNAIRIKEQDPCKTAFIFNGKACKWKVMPFGPTNAPTHLQKVMDETFNDVDHVMAYMDDITIISSSPEQLQQHLHEVFRS